MLVFPQYHAALFGSFANINPHWITKSKIQSLIADLVFTCQFCWSPFDNGCLLGKCFLGSRLNGHWDKLAAVLYTTPLIHPWNDFPITVAHLTTVTNCLSGPTCFLPVLLIVLWLNSLLFMLFTAIIFFSFVFKRQHTGHRSGHLVNISPVLTRPFSFGLVTSNFEQHICFSRYIEVLPFA